MARRRPPWIWLLVVLFIAMPLVEIWTIIQVGQAIGAWWTILLLVLDSILGSWLIKREGGRAWAALRTALHSGRMPARELADGALILIGGTLMLAPGFVTDALGILMILPFTRPVWRRLLAKVVADRLVVLGGPGGSPFGSPFGPPSGGASGAQTRQRPGTGQGPVVRGEVVDE